MITINIELKDRNRIKELLHKLYSRVEGIAFSITERFIPQWLMEWLDRYTTKRISQLKQQTIHGAWQKVYLEKAADEIANRQQDTKKAPSDD